MVQGNKTLVEVSLLNGYVNWFLYHYNSVIKKCAKCARVGVVMKNLKILCPDCGEEIRNIRCLGRDGVYRCFKCNEKTDKFNS